MKTTTHKRTRLLVLLLVVLGVTLGPGQALADSRPAPACLRGHCDGATGSIGRPAPADNLAARMRDDRHAALLRNEHDTGAQPASLSRPAPADNLAARPQSPNPAGGLTVSPDGFDYRDALIGAAVALAAALLLVAGVRAARGHSRLVSR